MRAVSAWEQQQGEAHLSRLKMATDGNHAIEEQHEPSRPRTDHPDEHNQPSNRAQLAASGHARPVPGSLQHDQQITLQIMSKKVR